MNSILRNQREIIRELLNSETSLGIIIGQDQNIDTVAAGLGLFLVLKNSGKDVQIVSRKDPSVEVSSLFGVDQIKKSFEGLTRTLTISVPYREGEIEKVSYNIDQDRLNVNLFAENSGISFSESDIEYIKKGSAPQLVITVGVANDTELSDFIDPKSTKTIHIDKNPINPLIGDASIIDPSFSSLSEVVASLIMELSLGFDQDAYQNLMDGITYATRNFTLQTTSPYAFETAGFLLQNGAKRKEKAERQNQRTDSRNFPNEDYFLNQKPRPARNQSTQPRQAKPQPINPVPQVEESADLVDEDLSQNNMPNINKASGETENAMPDEIPDDWFLPKVFKGSKRGN
jgi:nanoRNase/pAp phosphatase (c-di-AMP/oligoRNAs hydrolase)